MDVPLLDKGSPRASPPSSPSSSPRTTSEQMTDGTLLPQLVSDECLGAVSDPEDALSESTESRDQRKKRKGGKKRRTIPASASSSPGVPRLQMDDESPKKSSTRPSSDKIKSSSIDPVFKDIREEEYEYSDGRHYVGFWRAGQVQFQTTSGDLTTLF